MVDVAAPNSFKFDLRAWLDYIELNSIEIDLQKFQFITSRLARNDLPIIIGHSSLSLFLGISVRQLHSVLGAKNKFYREFKIPKRHGGFRKICTPYPFLYFIQRAILEKILSKYCIANVASESHGFMRGRSIKSNAMEHLANSGARLLKLDITNFFGSVNYSLVQNIFSEMGYDTNVSRWLARLCTHDGHLPQGAPTSPALSNLAFMNFDANIQKRCVDKGLIYTRYADDISISGDLDLAIVDEVKEILAGSRFVLNEKKTKLYKSGFSITGVSIANGCLSLPRKVKREYKQNIYYIEKFGINGSMDRQLENKYRYPERVLGQLMHWLNVEGPGDEINHAFNVYWAAVRGANHSGSLTKI